VIAVAISNAVAASDVSPRSAFTVEGVSADHWKLKFARVYQRLWGLPRRYGHSSARRPNLYDARRFERAARGNCEPIDGQRLLAGPARYWQAYARRQPAEGTPVAAVIGVVADTKMPRDVPSIDQWYTPMINPPLCTARELRETSAARRVDTSQCAQLLILSNDPDTRSTIAEIDPLLALQEVRPSRMRFLQLRHRDISPPT